MFVAAKYEETYSTEIDDFVYITDRAFTTADIRRMEVKILCTLQHYISFPLPLHFLRRNSKAALVSTLDCGRVATTPYINVTPFLPLSA